MVKILAIGQVEDDKFITEQVTKQTHKDLSWWFYVDENPAKGIKERRKRIASNHQKLQEFVSKTECDLVWQLEGDSELQENTLDKLLKRYGELYDKNFGYITGAQVGRHGVYAIGAWQSESDTKFRSVSHQLKGLEQIDASGFYCLLAPKDVWLKGQCSWTDEVYGPDVVWGLSLRDQGYNLYIDTDIEVGHKCDSGTIGLDNLNLCTVEFEYKDKWSYKTWQ